MTEEIEEPPAFEEAYARLEHILEKMNSGKITLDESIQFYEEADKLIASCAERLNTAERKIEMLIKNREGELSFSELQKPLTQPFGS